MIANISAAFLALVSHGFSVDEILSTSGLLSTANSVSIARYAGQGGSPIIAPLLGMGYCASLVAPFLNMGGGRHRTILVTAPLLSSLVYSAVTTERLGLLISAAFTVGGLIAAHVRRSRSVPRLGLRSVMIGVSGALILGTAFIGIAFLRVGRIDLQIANTIISKQQVYALGSVPAFSQWLESGTGDAGPLLGTSSLAGVEYLTGEDRDSTRAYDEFAVVDTNGSRSNVYTIFRGLILDFGEAGMLLVLSLLGFIFGRLFRLASGGSAVGAGALGGMYGVILLSSTMAVTTFTNVLVGFILALAVLAMAQRQSAKWPTVIMTSDRTVEVIRESG